MVYKLNFFIFNALINYKTIKISEKHLTNFNVIITKLLNIKLLIIYLTITFKNTRKRHYYINEIIKLNNLKSKS